MSHVRFAKISDHELLVFYVDDMWEIDGGVCYLVVFEESGGKANSSS